MVGVWNRSRPLPSTSSPIYHSPTTLPPDATRWATETAFIMNHLDSMVFWVVTPCSLVKFYRSSPETLVNFSTRRLDIISQKTVKLFTVPRSRRTIWFALPSDLLFPRRCLTKTWYDFKSDYQKINPIVYWRCCQIQALNSSNIRDF
jgi:hypothetical protein